MPPAPALDGWDLTQGLPISLTRLPPITEVGCWRRAGVCNMAGKGG